MMAADTRIRYLQILAELWGQAYLFHPAVLSGQVTPAWEQVLLAAIPAVEQVGTMAGLVACLNEVLFEPLQDPLSGAWLPSPPSQAKTGVCGRHCRPQTPSNSSLYCVHEGWNEHGRPYIYGRRWEAGPGQTGGDDVTAYPEGFFVRLQTGLPHFPLGPEPERPLYSPLPAPPEERPLTRTERLLGLFKTWTILTYFFPLADLAGDRKEDTAEFLAAWIPVIEAAESLEAFYRQMNRLAETLHDGHALAWHPVLAAPAELTPQNSGPELKNNPFGWPEAVKHLRQFDGNIVYMNPFSMPDTPTLLEAFDLIQPAAGLILDLRGYPQTHFQQALTRCLCRDKAVSPRYELPVVFSPDLSRRQWRLVQYTVEPNPTRPVFDKPVVALIHAETLSSAEDFGMYLKNAGRVVFVGTRTPGVAGNIATVSLPGGGWFSFTGMRVTWPDGRPFQGIGLCPDVEVTPSLPGQKRDEILEKGREVLQALIGSRHE